MGAGGGFVLESNLGAAALTNESAANL